MSEPTHRIDGALTSDTVPSRWKKSRAWKDAGLPAVIDLSGVDQADSSGVALLLEWLAWASARGDSIQFENAPEGLRTIAALSQVDTLLGWKETES